MTEQPRRIIRYAATGESMPPDSRHATRPPVPVGSPPAPALLAEEIERVVRQHLEVNRQRRIVEIDAPALRFLDAAADLALDLRRRERKALVGAAGADAERLGTCGRRGRRGSPRRARRNRAARGPRTRSSRCRRSAGSARAPRPAQRARPSRSTPRRSRCRSPISARTADDVEIRERASADCAPDAGRTTAGSSP